MKTLIVYYVKVFEDGSQEHDIVEIPDKIEAMHKLVGGWLEHVQPVGLSPQIDLWCNEEGLLQGLPIHPNPFWHEPIAGNYFLARHDKEGNTISLTPEDLTEIIVKMKFWRGDFS